jgi:hypothetical protein
MLLNQGLRLSHLLRFQTEVRGQFHVGINPKLRFTVRVLNVDVTASFLTREKVEPKSSDPKDRWTHRVSLAQSRGPNRNDPASESKSM